MCIHAHYAKPRFWVCAFFAWIPFHACTCTRVLITGSVHISLVYLFTYIRMEIHVFHECEEEVMATGPYISFNRNLTIISGSLMCPAGDGQPVVLTSLVEGSQHRVEGYSTGWVFVSHADPQPPQPQQPRVQMPNPNVLAKVLLKTHSMNRKDLAKTFLCWSESCDQEEVKHAVILHLRRMI